MTVTVSTETADTAPGEPCGLCGRPMQAGQEWCLECGAARTVIARPPDWRVPVLVIGVVVLLIAGGFAYALTQLGSSAGMVTVVGAGSTPRTTTAHALGAWEPGLAGYTVVLATDSSQSAADRSAQQLTAHFTDVGVLSTSQHPQMLQKNVWDVFAGHYPSYALAQAAAAKAARQQPGAKPALVQHPGQ